ncbi:unnamed protein product [Musa acuminata subsp. malaccensis]|uniref:(wild Malaysian banana) hypothetical protein n=1 Tax=Musa acuminata subsp. malaccensis TaxID=214687 RepID=A0A804L329_MUSAM|nr:PREDICTED: uncharacterized protein LOC103970156 isoform X1 [Musa acuminata subsp. malaccensis]CAG1863244.1 unnamed protein product [Musa acuminata subsp. malaccensis]
MDYERIHKPFAPQSGGFSPGRLRAMLLGVETKRKEREDLEANFSLRSESSESDDRHLAGASTAESCKDVECSISMETTSGHRSREYAIGGSRFRAQDDDCLETESVSSGFEFQRVERAPPHRLVSVAPFSKPAPSKWDDAQKWIASPTSNRVGNKAGGGQARKGGFAGHGSRQPVTKVVLEVEEADTKRVDGSQAKKEFVGVESVNWVTEPYAEVDSGAKPVTIMENPVADIAVSLSQHDSLTSVQSATAFISPAPTVRSVSMRDMGTEMTPIPSQEPSRTGTPVRESAPSPTSSRPTSPPRTALAPTMQVQTVPAACHDDLNKELLSEQEIIKKTRREIMVLGQQLGKTNIAAWASKEEEETDASLSLKTVRVDESMRGVIEARAAAWEEAEKAKYLARFKQEEIKIQAWENHQKAKTEAEMRKIEVEVERMRSHSHERLMNKLATARHRAEEMRAVAEAKRNQQAARTAQQAEFIRRTGRVPSSFFFWSCCR